MDRRDFLRLGLLGAAGLALAACRGRRPIIAEGLPAAFHEVVRSTIPEARPGLNVFQGRLEFVAGRTERLPFGLTDLEGRDLVVPGAIMWVAGGDGRVGDPFVASYHAYGDVLLPDDPAGFYAGKIDVPAGPGLMDILVAAGDDDETLLYGWATVQTRARATVVDLDEEAVSVPTPTTGNPRGVANVCTRIPACPLHEQRLDRVLALGQPVVLTISSPLLCTSRTCGPVLEEVLSLRDEFGDRARFVHVEPYRGNEPTVLAPAAEAWRIESEPWTFVIDDGGVVRARFEGPVVAEEIERELRAWLL